MEGARTARGGSHDPSDEETSTNTQIILDASMFSESQASATPRKCHAGLYSLGQNEFWLRNAEGNAYCIREVCVVGRVKMPLLAVGKLFRKGWTGA